MTKDRISDGRPIAESRYSVLGFADLPLIYIDITSPSCGLNAHVRCTGILYDEGDVDGVLGQSGTSLSSALADATTVRAPGQDNCVTVEPSERFRGAAADLR